MQIKRFVARDVRSALRLVREQLGPDAMILSNARSADGVELVAAPAETVASLSKGPPGVLRDIGRDAPAESRRPAASPLAGAIDTLPDVERLLREPEPEPESGARPEAVDAAGLAAMQEELRQLRELLERQLAQTPVPRQRDAADTILTRLRSLGLSTRFAAELSQATAVIADREQTIVEAMGEFQSRLRTAGDRVAEGGCFAFIGPTGAGKTTTLCKLAVREALAQGVDRLAILSMDRFRIGAGETLAAIGRLLGLPIVTLDEPGDLPTALDRLAGKRLVLIDTAGLGGRDDARCEQLQVLGAEARRVQSLLLLPASSQAGCLRRSLDAYREAQPVATVISRLDEASSLGEALEASILAGLPVAYTTSGVEIPEDIAAPDAATLVRLLQSLARTEAGSVVQERYNADRNQHARAVS